MSKLWQWVRGLWVPAPLAPSGELEQAEKFCTRLNETLDKRDELRQLTRKEKEKEEAERMAAQLPPKFTPCFLDNPTQVRGQLAFIEARLLAVPLDAYRAYIPNFAEFTPVDRSEREYTYPWIELTLLSGKETQLETDWLTVWVMWPWGNGIQLELTTRNAQFTLDSDSGALIIQPATDAGLKMLNDIGRYQTTVSPGVRLFLNGCAVQGSDRQLTKKLLDVDALRAEVPYPTLKASVKPRRKK